MESFGDTALPLQSDTMSNMTEKNPGWADRLQCWAKRDAVYHNVKFATADFQIPKLDKYECKFEGGRALVPFQSNVTTFVEVKFTFTKKHHANHSMMIGLATNQAVLHPLNTMFGRSDGQSCVLRDSGFVQDETGHCYNFTPSFAHKTSYTIGVLYNGTENTLGFSLDNSFLGTTPNALMMDPPYYLAVYCGQKTHFTAEITRCIYADTSLPGMCSPIANWEMNESTGKPLMKWEKQNREYIEVCEDIIGGDLKREWWWLNKEFALVDKVSSNSMPFDGQDSVSGVVDLTDDSKLYVWSTTVHTPSYIAEFAIGLAEKCIPPKHISLREKHEMHLQEGGDFWIVSNEGEMRKKGEFCMKYHEAQVCTRNYEVTAVFNPKAGRLAFYILGKIMCKPIENVFSENPLFPVLLYGGPALELTLSWTAAIPLTNDKARAYFKEAFPGLPPLFDTM